MLSKTTERLKVGIPNRRGGFFSNVAVLTGGSAASQALAIIASPIITRLYSPAHYGAWSLLLSVFVILSVVVCWRYEFAIVLPKEDDEAANIFGLSVLLTIGMMSLTAFSIWLFGRPIARLIGIESYALWLWCVPVLLLIFGLYQSSNYWCTRNEQFSRLAVSRISQSAGTISTQIGTGVLLGSNPAGLIIGRIVGQSIGTTVLCYRIIKKDLRVYLRSLSWDSMKSALFQYRNFPLYVAPYAFLSGFQHRAVYLLLGVFTTARVVGWFALAMRLMYLPIRLVSASMNQVFYQKAAAAPDLKELQHFVVRILTLMVILVTPLLVFLVFSANWLFGLVFGKHWAEAGTYGTIMAFPAFMLLITSWLDKIYYVLERQRLALVMEVVYDILSISLFLLALIFLKKPIVAVGIYAITSIIYNLFWLAVTFNICNFTRNSLFKIGLSFLLIFIFSAVVYLGLKLIVGQTVTIVIYGVILLIFYLLFFTMIRKKMDTAYDNERKVEELLAG